MIICYENYKPFVDSNLLVVEGKTYFDIPINNYTDNILNLPLGVVEKLSIHMVRNIPNIPKEYLCTSQYNMTPNANREYIRKFDFVTYIQESNTKEYLINLRKSKYCLSPHGIWPDCYRHWEAMYMNCIPITTKHKKLEKFYDMPILFLDDWSELTEEMLLNKYEEVSNRSKEKLNLEYWINLAKTIKGL